MRCPVCDKVTNHWVGFVIGFLLGSLLLLGFHTWRYERFVSERFQKIEMRNDELKQGYVPPRREK